MAVEEAEHGRQQVGVGAVASLDTLTMAAAWGPVPRAPGVVGTGPACRPRPLQAAHARWAAGWRVLSPHFPAGTQERRSRRDVRVPAERPPPHLLPAPEAHLGLASQEVLTLPIVRPKLSDCPFPLYPAPRCPPRAAALITPSLCPRSARFTLRPSPCGEEGGGSAHLHVQTQRPPSPSPRCPHMPPTAPPHIGPPDP